jgi:protein-S-isoprenylcysteine O-methyltransferase Ste14
VPLRLWALIVLFSALTISSVYRARARRLGGAIERRREGRLALGARAIGGLSALAAMLLHALAPGMMRWASFDAPPLVRWTGAGLGLLAIPGAWWVLSSIGTNVSETVLTKPDHELVQRGPYRWVRHPLYTLGVVLILAQALMLASWVLLLMSALALAAFRALVVPIEERHLESSFGDAYRQYRAQTGAMLPRLTGRR